MEKLVDRAEKLGEVGMSVENQLRMTMFPGLLCGFAPPNYEQLNERIGCSQCLEICEKLKVVSEMKIPKIVKRIPYVRYFFFKHINMKAKEILAEIKTIEEKDEVHWGEKNNRKISKEFVTAFMERDSWVYETISMK